MAWYDALPIVGDIIGAGVDFFTGKKQIKSSERQAELDRAYAKEFAQTGIQWRMEDANKAGINPLAALGAQTPSYSPPVQLEGGRRNVNFRDLGQNIGETIRKTLSPEAKRLAEAEIRKSEAEAKIAEFHSLTLERKLNEPQSPGIPTDKMGIVETNLPPDPLYRRQPLPTSQATGEKEGFGPAGKLVVDRQGFLSYYPTQDIQDLISEDLPAKFSWYKGLAGYKVAMSWGELRGSARYKSEKARLERQTGRKLFWDSLNFKWRLDKFRSKNHFRKIKNFYGKGFSLAIEAARKEGLLK